MSTNIMNTDASAEINHWTEKAFSTYLFLSRLPSPLSNFVFKRIIDEAYSIASALPKAVRIDSVLEGISNAIDLNCENFSPLQEYLQIKVSEKNEIDSIIAQYDRREIKKGLCARFKLWDLPAKEDLVDAYLCFSQTVPDDDVIDNHKEIVRNKLTRLLSKYGRKFFEKPKIVKLRPFQTLGYKTLFNEWFNDNTDQDMDLLFFRWYCQGDLLNIVLDSIFRGESTTVSQIMWQYIKDACKKDYYLSELTKEQYNEYRRFNPTIPLEAFDFMGLRTIEAKAKSLGVFPALPRIVDKTKEFVPENEIFLLYGKLVQKEYLDEKETPFEAFHKVFSGEGRSARPIIWHGRQKQLASFLAFAQGGSTSKEYSKTATKLFLRENGKPCQMNTLNQPDYKFVNEFDNMLFEIRDSLKYEK